VHVATITIVIKSSDTRKAARYFLTKSYPHFSSKEIGMTKIQLTKTHRATAHTLVGATGKDYLELIIVFNGTAGVGTVY